MPDKGITRKLATILFADIQGYSAIVQNNEADALKKVAQFKASVDEFVPQHGGEIIQFYGDGFLILFNSAVKALRCARALQLSLIESGVPVRMGLHSGEVVVNNDQIFGDTVNIASRIESAGVPGSILLSKLTYDQIKNQEDLGARRLGRFAFKNINENLEVFALKSDGLTIPALKDLPKDMKGSFKSSKWLFASGITFGFLAIIIFAVWSIFFKRTDSQVLDKRLIVETFQNQSSQEDLLHFGTMISDWITQGLMNLEEVNVINSQSIQKQLMDPKFSAVRNPQFADETGVEVLLRGRFFNMGNELYISANLTEVRTGLELKNFQVKGEIENRMMLLEELTNGIVDYWNVKDTKLFMQKPPKYEAYQEWLVGKDHMPTDPNQAKQNFLTAFEIDTNFFAPVFSLMSIANSHGDQEAIEQYYQLLDRKQSLFSDWERLKYKSLQGYKNHDFLLSANVNAQMYEMDNSDIGAATAASYYYNLANYPDKSLEILDGIDFRLVEEGQFSVDWNDAQKAHAFYQLERYEDILKIIEHHPYTTILIPLVAYHIKALIRLERYEDMFLAISEYLKKRVISPIGTQEDPFVFYVQAADELFILRRGDVLSRLMKEMKPWISVEWISEPSHSYPDLHNNLPMRLSELKGYYQFYQGNIDSARMEWQKEIVPEYNWADHVELWSRLGYCHGQLGEFDQAKEMLSRIDALQVSYPQSVAHKAYYKARILTSIGEDASALNSIQLAVKNGFISFRPSVFNRDPLLASLLSYKPYVDFLKPR